MYQVAVVLPVYNSSPFLKECLDSVFNQTYSNFVIYAVDDGSTDNSLEILRYYERKDSRIKIISQSNQGVSGARNTALKALAQQHELFQYVVFLDSDDILEKNCFAKCASEIGSADILVYDFITFDDQTQKPTRNSVVSKEVLNHAQFCDRYFHLNRWSRNNSSDFFLCNKFFTYPVLKDLFFDTSLKRAEDQDLMIRLLPRVKQAVLLPDQLYFYRVRQDSLSRTKSYDDFSDEFSVYRRYMSHGDFSESMRQGIQTRFLQKLWSNLQSIFRSPLSVEQKYRLYKKYISGSALTFEFPLSKKECKRLMLLRLGFTINLLLANLKKR